MVFYVNSATDYTIINFSGEPGRIVQWMPITVAVDPDLWIDVGL